MSDENKEIAKLKKEIKAIKYEITQIKKSLYLSEDEMKDLESTDLEEIYE